jgi:ribosome-associated toxin RatA of RatAB toxin-antitoxin module
MTELSHEIVICSDAATVFEACRNVRQWPTFMPAVRQADFVEQTHDGDTVSITAEANDSLWTWHSRRIINKNDFTISFERIAPTPPILRIGGTWTIIQETACSVRLKLDHHFLVGDNSLNMEDFLASSIRSNATRDLRALQQFCTIGGAS